jgi:type I restriction enzyme S subunit
LEMFGDPVTNPKRLSTTHLGEVAEFISGGTPSTEIPSYWDGTIPWVSPKDMKVVEIFDAQDHVSERAIAETALKDIAPETILIVVRGMILAHTIPIAITRSNIKGLSFHSKIKPTFALWALMAQRRYILTKVKTAAHGTRRIDTNDLSRLPFLLPDYGKQEMFVEAATVVASSGLRLTRSLEAGFDLFSSLQHRAFSGQL